MSSKTVPLSVRISHDDAEYIAGLKIDDALTPSDKVRAIIRDARKESERSQDYEGFLKIAKDRLVPVMQRVQAAENAKREHSQLVNAFYDWMAESFAYAAAAATSELEDDDNLRQLEEGIADRVFRLFETVLRMGVTSKAPCYDTAVIIRNAEPLLEINDIIKQRVSKEK